MSKASVDIAARIDAALAEGTVPWAKPWIGGQDVARNLVSKRPYSGINVLLLALSDNPGRWWVTYKQAEKLGGHVNKGEHATWIYFWAEYCPTTKKSVRGKCSIPGHTRKDHALIQRGYKVFNAETQCSGLEKHIPATRSIVPDNDGALDIGLRLVDALHDYDLPVIEGGAQAFYRPQLDDITLPPTRLFIHGRRYYWTALHELVHSTGHKSRLDRFKSTDESLKDYAREELIAEIGSAIGARRLGFEPDIEQSAAYIDHWRQAIKDDPDLVMVAAQRASKAIDLLFSTEEE